VSTLLFPRLKGVGWGTTIAHNHFYTDVIARSGRSVSVQHAAQPVTKITISYSDDGFLDDFKPAPTKDGSVVYSDYITMLGFFNYHGGGAQRFLFQGVSDRERREYSRRGERQFIGDGATKIFQLVRNVGIFAESIYWPMAAPTVYVNGVAQAAASITALGNGQYQFAGAPAANAVVTADFVFAYRCKFDAKELSFKNWCEGYWSVETPLITVKP